MLQITPNWSFDEISRHVDAKIDIYFEETPMSIYSKDYLIDFNILEECSEDTNNPLGAPAANAIDITLYNDNDIFTPTNKNSPLYKQIKLGIRICPYFCCTQGTDIEITSKDIVWVPMGVFYVTDWKVTGDRLVKISGYDILYKLLNETFPSVFIKQQITYKDFILDFLSSLNYESVFLSNSNGKEFATKLAYTPYQSTDKIADVLLRFTQATWSLCYANRKESIIFNALSNKEPLADLTENNQVLDLNTQQSIIKTYEGVNLTYYRYQRTGTKKLLNVSDLEIPLGSAVFGPYEFSENVLRIAGLTSNTDDTYYNCINNWKADCKSILLHTTLGNFIVLYAGYYDNHGLYNKSEVYTCSIDKYLYNPERLYTLYTTKSGIDIFISWYDEDGNFLNKSVLTTSEDGKVLIKREDNILYQLNTLAGSYVYADGSITNETSAYMVRLDGKIECSPAEEYTIKLNRPDISEKDIVCFWWDLSGGYKQYTKVTLNSEGNAVFTIPEDVYFFSAHFPKNFRPAGDTIDIKGPLRGKNINTDITVTSGLYDITTGEKKEADNRSRIDTPFKVTPNTLFLLDTHNKAMVGGTFRVLYYDGENNYLSSQSITITRRGNGLFTTPENCHFITAYFSTSIIAVDKVATITSPGPVITPKTFTFYALKDNLALGSNVSLLLEGEIMPSTGKANITIFGEAIEATKVYKHDNTSNALSIDNCYIQDEKQAFIIKDLWEEYIHADVPVLEVSVRGNPLLEIGDAIHVICPSKKVDFSGIIMRADYSFNGSLSCTLTLLNLDILKDRG